MRATEKGLTEAVVLALRDQGVDLRLEGGVARLVLDGTVVERPWVLHPSSRHRDWHERAALREGTMVLTERMTASAAAEARARGVWYADTDGRLYVRAPGVLLHLSDRPSSTRSSAAAVRPRIMTLTSPGRAQVVACLLAWPELSNAPVRVLAQVAGVSLGLAQQVVTVLGEEKYLTVGKGRLINVADLLDRWAGAFGLGLARRLELGRFTGTPDATPWARVGHIVFVSGPAAATDLRGSELSLYVPEMDSRAVLAAGWHRSRSEGTNVVVRQQFWTEPDALGMPDSPFGDVRDAPPPLVYGDLIASGESRQRDAARDLKERIVGLHAR